MLFYPLLLTSVQDTVKGAAVFSAWHVIFLWWGFAAWLVEETLRLSFRLCLTVSVTLFPLAVNLETMCADDLLSVLLYLLVKTEIPNW